MMRIITPYTNRLKMNNLKKYITEGLSGLCLCLCLFGCSKICTNGETILCSTKNQVYIGQFCTSQDIPPCECYGDDGANWVNQVSKFTKSCDPSIGGNGGVGAITIDQPYSFACDAFEGNLCVQYDTYFCDRNSAQYGSYESYDNVSRPIYVGFNLNDFSLKNFDYVFKIKDPLYNQIVQTVILNGSSPSTDVLRYLDPTICNDEKCETNGVVKMDIKNGHNFGTYKIIFSKIAHDDVNKTEVEIAQGSFIVKKDDRNENGYTTNRVLKFVVFKNGQRDLSSYDMANRSISGGLLNYVFGDSKSNMRFTSITKEIVEPYIDRDGDMMLNDDYFSFFDDLNTDVLKAQRAWTISAYNSIEYDYPQYQGFAVEAEFMKKYDFSQNPPTADASFRSDALEDPILNGTLGITLKNESGENFYNGLIVFRTIARLNYSAFETNAMSLTACIHELGHLWSISATVGSPYDGSCEAHIWTANGKNFHECLFHVSCISYGQNPMNEEEWVSLAIEDPKFCEGHQQYFMNRLAPR